MKITDEILEKWFENQHRIKKRDDYHKMIELTLGELYEEIHWFLIENKLIEQNEKNSDNSDNDWEQRTS